MRVFVVGSEAVSTILKLKYNSRNKFTLFFWDNSAATIPTDLTGVVVTIELDEIPGSAPTVWTATNATNGATFDQTAASSQFAWDSRPFRVVFTKAGARDVVMTGEAEVQR
jgi:hypothetical protein